VVSSAGFADGKIVERFDCYDSASLNASLFKEAGLEGVNFFARKLVESRDYSVDTMHNG
jgi:hypothetical protein